MRLGITPAYAGKRLKKSHKIGLRQFAKRPIPLTSQIILILDEYFALIEPRPYRAKLSSRDALEIIKADSGKKWNSTLVKEFISLIEHDIV